MIFRYVPLEAGYGTYYMPLLFADIFHPEDSTKKQKLLCLVDSGAGATLINDEYADALGIDLKTGREVPIMGIEASPVTAYGHMLTIKLMMNSQHFLPCVTSCRTFRPLYFLARRGSLITSR